MRSGGKRDVGSGTRPAQIINFCHMLDLTNREGHPKPDDINGLLNIKEIKELIVFFS
jgi:hypothetical protein